MAKRTQTIQDDDSERTPEAQGRRLISSLSEIERKLFLWVREREKRQDYGTNQGRVGAPSPKQKIVDFVQTELIPDDAPEASREQGE